MSFDKINVWFVGSFFWRARCALSDPHMLCLWRPFANWSYRLYYIITFNSDQSHTERPMQFDQHVLQYHFSCSFVLIVTDFLTHNSIPVHCLNVVTIQWKMTERQWDSSGLESCCQKWNGALYVSALWQNPIWRSFHSPCRMTNQNLAC